jgi:hypothetical protein
MADQTGLPEDVRRFITERITSADQLEVLLLLHGDPRVDWDAAAVSRALYTQDAAGYAVVALFFLRFWKEPGTGCSSASR